MSQSLSKLYVHIVFHVKNNRILIRPETEQELYAYIGGVIKKNASIPIRINGVGNHIHILSTMSKNISLAKLVEEIKTHSSRWIKTKGNYYKDFAWQGGYGGFSVSQSAVDIVSNYIDRQKLHHRKLSREDEYVSLLRKHSVVFDDNYLWG